jgi:hypothetical protein
MSNLSKFNIDWNLDYNLDKKFSPLSEGIYGAKITSSEIKDTKAGDGSYISLQITLLGGKGVKGRKVFQMHMIKHPKPMVVNIGLRNLKDLAKSIGLEYDNITDTTDFHDKVVGVELGIESSEQYGDKNVVKRYLEFDESLLSDTSTEESVF